METNPSNNLRFLVIVLATGLIISAMSSVFLFMEKNKLSLQVSQAKQILAKMEEETGRATAEKDEIIKEKEKLQADAISYIGINANLTREKEEVEGKLKAALEIIASKEQELKEAGAKLKQVDKKLTKQKHTEGGKLDGIQDEKNKLLAKVSELEGTLKKERGVYHYNLAVAYTQAQLYDEAVDSYNRSLEFNPGNADAYYNLGLLYENVKGDPETAISHYRKYLELNPNAGDRDEIEAKIRKEEFE